MKKNCEDSLNETKEQHAGHYSMDSCCCESADVTHLCASYFMVHKRTIRLVCLV
jgi:hypothetical protein